MRRFSLEAYVKTKGQSSNKKDITPRNFKVGDRVREVDPFTKKPYDGEDLVRKPIWFADTWKLVNPAKCQHPTC